MSISKVIMLIVAILLDLFGLINTLLDLAVVGLLISFIIDFLGILTIGIWAFQKGRSPAEVPTKSLAKIGTRIGLATISELIPVWGDIFPSWVIFVLTTKE